jgi:hypothetical protein
VADVRLTINGRVLENFGADVARRIAADVLAAAVAGAPQRLGTLGGSGTMQPDPDNPSGWVVSFPVFYAPFVEFGTVYWPVSVPPKVSGRRPFLGPALAEVAAAWGL